MGSQAAMFNPLKIHGKRSGTPVWSAVPATQAHQSHKMPHNASLHQIANLEPQGSISRRQAGALLAAAATILLARPSYATDSEDLPRGYEDTARSLLETLRDAIETDLGGAAEQEVRRTADPAKDLVKQFLTRWRDNPEVKDEKSYTELVAALQELGQFYKTNGQRTRMTETVGSTILDHLAAVELALPPKQEKKSLLPF